MYIKDKNGDVIRWDFHGGNLGIMISYLSKIGVSIIYLSQYLSLQVITR